MEPLARIASHPDVWIGLAIFAVSTVLLVRLIPRWHHGALLGIAFLIVTLVSLAAGLFLLAASSCYGFGESCI